MLAKHSLLYVLARGLPGLVNFAALAIYTRLLTPSQYGQYALVLALVGMLNMLIFEWLHLGLLRYLLTKIVPKPVFLATLLKAFLTLAVICVLGGIFWFSLGSRDQCLIFPGLALLLCTGFFNLNLQLKSAQLQPIDYGRLSAGKAVISLIVGAGLVYYGLGAQGALYGLASGMIVASVFWAKNEWQGLKLSCFDKGLLHKLVIYGLPLSVNLAMAEIISSSDRLFLKWMHNEATTGLYAAGYDLASHILGVILMIINLAAYPLAVRALEQHGKKAACQQLQKNFVLIVAIVFPAAAGLAVLASGVTGLIIGEEFQNVAQTIVPWVALAALLAGLKSYYFDMAFQLGQKTVGQLKVLVVAALVNLVLNFILIPDYAVMGAIYATVIAYAVGLVLSAVKGRKYFQLPVPGVEIIKITGATAIMSLIILPFHKLAGIVDFLVSVTMGAIVYLFMILILDVAGARAMANQLFSGVKRAG